MKYVLNALAALVLLSLPAVAADDGYKNSGMSLEGIGKSYMGREIAFVMGHEGAGWLERGSREQEEGTSKLLPLLGLKPTDTVADIGAGTGYFSFRLSAVVNQGKVFAEDIQQEMLDMIKARKDKGEGKNIVTVLGGINDPRLPPNAIDLILLVDAYHEFSYPREMGQAMVRALKPGGRIALVEYRAEDDSVPIKELHRMSVAQAKKEMAAVGLNWVSTDSTTLPWQHVMIFQKPGA
ncbi:MAG: class I SAM-dependent methyltransferase [Rhodospirillaceae bacterium]|nr:class I SAM-dependent methyltransferase [Rhodospirillaceae bacterium]